MTAEGALSLFHAMLLIGGILAAAGGFGVYFAGEQVQGNKDKAAAAQRTDLSAKIDELLSGNAALNDRLEPFEELAKRYYPGVEESEALERLRGDVASVRERTTQLESKTSLRSLNEEQSTRLEQALRALGSREVDIVAVMGDQEAFQFAKQLDVVFKRSGWQSNGVS